MMSNKSPILPTICCVGLILAGGSGTARAAEIFNTGANASGQPLSLGSSDPHWTVISGPGVAAPAPALALAGAVYVEFPTRPDSAWIWVSVGAAQINSPHTFRTRFTLTPEEASSLNLSGSWSVDNT
jgi:hypothetical protein